MSKLFDDNKKYVEKTDKEKYLYSGYALNLMYAFSVKRLGEGDEFYRKEVKRFENNFILVED